MGEEMKTERLQLVVEPSVLQKIDDFRFDQRIGSRSDAVRRLLVKGLENEKAETVATVPAE